MPAVLTMGSSITCPASGKVVTSGQSKLRVGGMPALVISGINGHSVGGCTTPTSSSPTSKTCLTVASAGGAAIKLKVGGMGVALDTLVAATDGTLPKLTATANQTKLKAS
jgi:hypothetical protein